MHFRVGATGASCDEVCSGVGEACARDWFLYLDRCAVARAAFPQSTSCREVHRASAPVAVDHLGEVLVSRDGRSDPPTCLARPTGAASGRRLCGYEPRSHTLVLSAKQGRS